MRRFLLPSGRRPRMATTIATIRGRTFVHLISAEQSGVDMGTQVSGVTRTGTAGGRRRPHVYLEGQDTDRVVSTSAVGRVGPACVIAAFSFPASRLERPPRFRASRPAL